MKVGDNKMSDLLEILEYQGEGYKPLVHYGAWRVAILRWIAGLQPENQTYMERHMQTDEVFVLLNGQAWLVLGGKSTTADSLRIQKMEAGKLYNVKQNVWHTVVLTKEATILIVEEDNTGEANTEYCDLTEEFRSKIIGLG